MSIVLSKNSSPSDSLDPESGNPPPLENLRPRYTFLKARCQRWLKGSLASLAIGVLSSALAGLASWFGEPSGLSHVLIPHVLEQATSPGLAEYRLVESFQAFAQGPFGLGIATTLLLTGIVIGLTRNTPLPLFLSAITAATLYMGPGVCSIVAGPLAPAYPSGQARPFSFQKATTAQVQAVLSKTAKHSPKYLPVLWVAAQDDYFQKPHPVAFRQNLDILDQAWVRHAKGLPGSVTPSRLFQLDQAAKIQEPAPLLQAHRSSVETYNVFMGVFGWGSIGSLFLAFALAIPSTVIQRRLSRLRQTFAEQGGVAPLEE